MQGFKSEKKADQTLGEIMADDCVIDGSSIKWGMCRRVPLCVKIVDITHYHPAESESWPALLKMRIILW